MCLICVEFQKQKMTVLEARRAFREMSVSLEAEHIREVEDMLDQAESEGAKTNVGGEDAIN
jgi:hypothetical protein